MVAVFWAIGLARASNPNTNRTHHSVSDTADNSRDDELSETPMRSERCNTNDRTDNHDEASKQHHPSSSETFTDEEGDHRTEESSTVSQSLIRIGADAAGY